MLILILTFTGIISWLIGGVMGMTLVECRFGKAAKSNYCISLDGKAYKLTEVKINP